MGKDEKKILAFASTVVVAWAVLFYLLVCPMYDQRDQAVGEAQKKIERLAKLTAGSPETWDITKATESLEKEAAALQAMVAELKAIEAGPLGPYSIAETKGKDPNAFFAGRRVELIEKIRAKSAVQLAPAIANDLGFRDMAATDPIALNLVRLHVLDRFFDSAKAANVHEVVSIQYPSASIMPRPAGLEIEGLVQVPIVVRLRLPEPALGPLLYELDPNPKLGAMDRYFCIRALQATVKDDKSGLLDVLVNLGALYTQAQMREQDVTIKDEERPGLGNFVKPFGDSTRY